MTKAEAMLELATLIVPDVFKHTWKNRNCTKCGMLILVGSVKRETSKCVCATVPWPSIEQAAEAAKRAVVVANRKRAWRITVMRLADRRQDNIAFATPLQVVLAAIEVLTPPAKT